MLDIQVNKAASSKIESVDFNNLGFGKYFTDHMLVCDYNNGSWQTPEIVPYQPITLDPSAKIFHYGQSVFEGMKAYKDQNDEVFLFRPIDNFNRLNASSKRMCIPELPEAFFMEGLKQLIKLEQEWIPKGIGNALYIRPFIFATGTGVHASQSDSYKFIIACSPSSAYFAGKVKVLIEQKYARAANGGVGYAKAGGNYGAQFYPTMLAKEKGYDQVIWTDDATHQYIEEAGAMNIFVRINDTLITAPTSERILAGVTRKSLLEIAEKLNIPHEVRPIKIAELIEAAKTGMLKEMFGAGTAAVISPIAGFGFQDDYYELPEVTNSYAETLKNFITNIQTNQAEDPFGWRVKV
jgi:branched-chain amino acid aminotransferase